MDKFDLDKDYSASYMPLQKVVPPPKGEKWGSIKSLEKYLATLVSPEEARAIMGPLAGAYDLRLADAHLPAEELTKAYELLRIDPKAPPLDQGFWLAVAVVEALNAIGRIMVAQHDEQRVAP